MVQTSLTGGDSLEVRDQGGMIGISRRAGIACLFLLSISAAFAEEPREAAIAACRDDYGRLCRGIMPGGGAIRACLQAHLSELSAACRAIVGGGRGGGEGRAGQRETAPGAGSTVGPSPTVRIERGSGEGGGRSPTAGSEIRRFTDVAYGPTAAQRLDIRAPATARGAPILVLVHGGAWRFGDKANGRVIEAKAAHWVPRGWVVVSVDYRMLPEADPLAQAADVGRALTFVASHAVEWGGDPRRIVAMGHSAGAHLVSLLAVAPEIGGSAFGIGTGAAMATVALDSAAFDVPAIMNARHMALYDTAFGQDSSFWAKASPADRLTRAPTPMLLVCSTRRAESCDQARSFSVRVHMLGGRADVLDVAKSHGDINADLGLPGDYTMAVDRFLSSLGLP